MRVLHVTEALGGGVQSAIVNYVDGLPDIDHAVFSRARTGQQTSSWSGDVAHESYAGGLAGFFIRLREKVRVERPDLVHLHSSFAGAARAVLPREPAVVYSPHCYAMERRDVAAPVRWGFGAVEFALARRGDLTMAVSPREADISRRLSARTPVSLVLNPSPWEPSAPSPTGLDAPARREVVTVGRVSAQKAPALFGAVAAAAREDPPLDATFVWIGDGDPPRVAELRSAGVEVTGWMPPADVRRRLATAALYLHTAAWEGGPVSTVEAASLGLPVLARGIPSMVSLGYPDAGETPEQILGAVRRYFDDRDYAAGVAAASAEVVTASSRTRMRDGLRAAYASAVASASTRRRPSAR